MKKIAALLVIFLGISSFAGAFNISDCEERMFTVTAYYSPESGQIFYYKSGFQEEVILNGEGYTGASGKKVFNGMLAGPVTYPFGSSIYFPGLGVGEIADRGGAIVLSGERGQSYDRIDVWMGRGEEGLIRALTFGKKNMTGYFCGVGVAKLSSKDILLWENIPVFKYFFDMALRIQQLEEGRNDIRARTLQKYLVKFGYLNQRYRNGTYESHTKKALCNYQVAKKIVSRKNPDCGKFGKTTRYVMKIDAQNKSFLPKNLYETGRFESIMDLAKYYNGRPMPTASNQPGITSTAQSVPKPDIFNFYRAYTKGQQSAEIKTLQTFLQQQGLYTSTIDGIYSKSTMDAVYEFQKKHTLISDQDPLSLRGYLGPKTRSKINELRRKNG